MPEDTFKDFLFVPTTKQMIETAISRANKKSGAFKQRKDEHRNVRTREIKKIEIAFDYIIEYLDNIVKSVPTLENLPPFYFELSQILVDNDLLRKKLGRISGVTKVLEKLKRDQIRKVWAKPSVKDMKLARKEGFGRLKSILDKLSKDFEYLANTRKKLKSLPGISTSIPGIVFAGYPNVGKSSCINNICGSKIKVAHYPFTTKEIKIGLYKHEFFKLQFIDTPGILDRPMKERNEIELQAITAMNHVANLIIFVIDPTITCGFSLEAQLELLKEIRNTFSTIDRMILVNKIDLVSGDEIKELNAKLHEIGEEDIKQYSALTREGEDEFRAQIFEKIKPFQN